jgi:hypothetical protein
MATKKKVMRTYLVWEVEYPDEGSFEVRGTSPAHARAGYRTMTGESDVELDSCLLTPKLKKERAARAKAESKALTCERCHEDSLHCRCAAFVMPKRTA